MTAEVQKFNHTKKICSSSTSFQKRASLPKIPRNIPLTDSNLLHKHVILMHFGYFFGVETIKIRYREQTIILDKRTAAAKFILIVLDQFSI